MNDTEHNETEEVQKNEGNVDAEKSEHGGNKVNQSYRSHPYTISSLSPNPRLQKQNNGKKEGKNLILSTKKVRVINRVTLNDTNNSLVLNRVTKNIYRPSQKRKNGAK